MIENPIRVITIYPNFSNKGGAQNIALLLAEKLNEINTPIVLVETPLSFIVKDYKARAQFEKFSLKKLYNMLMGILFFYRIIAKVLLCFYFISVSLETRIGI